ncbi:hypothetical protein ACT3TZ_07115 [Brachybacterium sp. AOP25-B2-12]|uniref:hypothetical protein n=1 Tax=Brachybacterium sp. AOP25-B2-12 TaxID=3457710 RepID=UPI00403383DB
MTQVGHTIFDTFMIWLPIWLPFTLIGLGVQWLVVRSATISALRRHEADRAQKVDERP